MQSSTSTEIKRKIEWIIVVATVEMNLTIAHQVNKRNHSGTCVQI